MGKKILVMTGSPRPNSKTDELAKAFAEGAQEAGNEVYFFDAGRGTIKGCIGCNACWSKGEGCVVDPNTKELMDLYTTCEGLVISTPLYWFGFPAQIKAAIDKLYPVSGSTANLLAVKESAFIVSGALPADHEEYGPIKETYDMMARWIGWKDHGTIVAGGIETPGALEASGYLEQARELGRAF